MKIKKNFFVIIEFAWILMAIFCLGMGIYYNVKIGIHKAWIIYSLGVISLGMFGARRMQRKNNENRQNRKY
ncbi:MAG: hypothetical protein PHP52_02650 [Bacteroidales bacterium]|nr:hypothetical protein [Bacteroidales bacterium]MDD4216512.1 hypothetical protein [Bacteroidales bacterium]MDY0141458.1 hypothetical protein [Bacteroidales bacterium]